MRFRSMVGLICVVLVACESPMDVSPGRTDHAIADAITSHPMVSAVIIEGDTAMVPGSFTSTLSANVEEVTFRDVAGNTYRYRATYNSAGRLASLASYINGNLVGRVVPAWSAAQITSSKNYDPDNQWVETDAPGTPTLFSNRNPYEGLCEDGAKHCDGNDPMSVNLIDSEASSYSVQSYASFEARFRQSQFTLAILSDPCDYNQLLMDWIWNTVGLYGNMFLTGAATGSAFTSGGLTGYMAVGSWLMFASHSRTWARSFRALDNCRRERAGLPPRL